MNEKKTSKLLKVHLGCGKNALDGFLNFDNNLFLFFKFIPFIENFLSFFKFIPKWFCEFITISREKISSTVMLQKKFRLRIQQWT